MWRKCSCPRTHDMRTVGAGTRTADPSVTGGSAGPSELQKSLNRVSGKSSQVHHLKSSPVKSTISSTIIERGPSEQFVSSDSSHSAVSNLRQVQVSSSQFSSQPNVKFALIKIKIILDKFGSRGYYKSRLISLVVSRHSKVLSETCSS